MGGLPMILTWYWLPGCRIRVILLKYMTNIIILLCKLFAVCDSPALIKGQFKIDKKGKPLNCSHNANVHYNGTPL